MEAAKEAERHTIVGVHAVLSSAADVRDIVHRLQELSRAHATAAYRFVLLSDFADADSESTSEDGAIIAALRAGIDRLNSLGHQDGGDRFLALHRRRTWSITQGMWIGFERKRGKLQELMWLLANPDSNSTFSWFFGDVPALCAMRIRYVLSLDVSTWITYASAFSLLKVACHPSNRAIVDPVTRTVDSGYTIFQPRLHFTVQTTHAQISISEAHLSRLHLGLTSFHFAVFDEGLHQGAAGLYDIAAFNSIVARAFSIKNILHHDMIDGFLGRTAEVADSHAWQPWPRTYLAQAMRGHRWIRGIFQALPLLGPLPHDAEGLRRHNSLTLTQRYRIAEFALYELEKPAALVLMLLAWTVLPGPIVYWMIAGCPPIASLAVTLVRLIFSAIPKLVRGESIYQTTLIALSEAATALFAVVTLAIDSVQVVDAFTRTMWRLAVSQRNLLDWHAWRELDRDAGVGFVRYWRRLWTSPAIGAATLIGLWHSHSRDPLGALLIPTAWMMAPAIIWFGDRQVFASRSLEQ